MAWLTLNGGCDIIYIITLRARLLDKSEFVKITDGGIDMKKILLVDASPRVNGNSENIIKILAEDLKDYEVTVFKMREKKCNPCLACGVCQGREDQICVQKDDIAKLLPVIDGCDSIVIATPIYNQQICSQAKLFIERWYPFFKFDGPGMSNSSKTNKKGALVCSFLGSSVGVTQKYADWTVSGFGQMGASQTKAILFPQIPNRGDVLNNPEYVEKIHELAKWLAD